MKAILTNKWTWIVSILILVNIASITSLWIVKCSKHDRMHFKMDGHRPPFGKHGGGLDMWEEQLKLTDKQKLEFDKLKMEHFKTIDSSFIIMKELREELISSIGKPEAEAQNVLNKIGLQEIEMQRNMYLHFSKMYSLCDDQQKEILKEQLLNMNNHRGGRPPIQNNCPNGPGHPEDMPPPPF